jgi:general secretion pathway protein I
MNRFDGPSANKGITLIEVMVAFVILALSVTVLLRIFSSGLSNTLLSQQYVDAVTLAESQLAQIDTVNELVPTVYSGSIDRFVWQTSIRPYLPWTQTVDEVAQLSAFVVDVEVSWRERGKQRQVHLSSIKLQNNRVARTRG